MGIYLAESVIVVRGSCGFEKCEFGWEFRSQIVGLLGWVVVGLRCPVKMTIYNSFDDSYS